MLIQRLLTVLIAAPFLIGAIVFPVPVVFKLIVTICLLVGLLEFFGIVGLGKREQVVSLIFGGGYILYLLFCPRESHHDLFVITALILFIFSFYCLQPKKSPSQNRSERPKGKADDAGVRGCTSRSPTQPLGRVVDLGMGSKSIEGTAQKMGLTVMGILYIGTFGSYVGLMRDLPHGVFWVLTTLVMTWMNDTSAYFFGHRFGRHRLAPLISPGKTIEGFLGGFLGSFLGFLFFWFFLENSVSFSQGLILVLLVGILGPLGDLSESLIKRSFHVKDSGNIIPGHGGMMDRIDALLFTAPIIYFFASRIG